MNLAGQMLFLGDPACNSFGHEEMQGFLVNNQTVFLSNVYLKVFREFQAGAGLTL